eukprot:8426431-Alexandrium_andersonii.AAC.1
MGVKVPPINAGQARPSRLATAGAATADTFVLTSVSGGARKREPSNHCFLGGRPRALSALSARARPRSRLFASLIASTA